MSTIIKKIENLQIKQTKLDFKTGDTICVNFKIIDNKYKNKTQNFEGVIISLKNNGLNTTCTIRKFSFKEGVEKTFFVYSPTVNWIKVKKYGVVRKSKIYYIKKLKGKAAKIKERMKKRRDVRVA